MLTRTAATRESFRATNPHAVPGARERGVAFRMVEDAAVSVEQNVRIGLLRPRRRWETNQRRNYVDEEGEAKAGQRGAM